MSLKIKSIEFSEMYILNLTIIIYIYIYIYILLLCTDTIFIYSKLYVFSI